MQEPVIRVKTILDSLKKEKKIKIDIVVTTSMIINKHGNVIDNIKKDGFKIGYKIHNLVSDENLTYQADNRYCNCWVFQLFHK